METEKGEGGPVRAGEGEAEAWWERPQECRGQWSAEGLGRVEGAWEKAILWGQ